jgi:putative alpha-1,2-mannosidase
LYVPPPFPLFSPPTTIGTQSNHPRPPSFVPHDQAALITLYGGPTSITTRLDYLHSHSITYIGNEPSFLTVFQYHYAGRPALSALRAHAYIPASFRPTPDGLPGNDDSGALGSFLAFAMMGLFPNPGQDVYLVTPPFFEAVHVTHPLTNRTARVRNVNFDPAYEAVYVQSATLDGAVYTRNWVDHSFFTEGKELVLVLGRNESDWARGWRICRRVWGSIRGLGGIIRMGR